MPSSPFRSLHKPAPYVRRHGVKTARHGLGLKRAMTSAAAWLPRAAAQSMGMSSRAAWGKIQQSERALGVKPVEHRGAKREGLRLTRGSDKANLLHVSLRALSTCPPVLPRRAGHPALIMTFNSNYR